MGRNCQSVLLPNTWTSTYQTNLCRGSMRSAHGGKSLSQQVKANSSRCGTHTVDLATPNSPVLLLMEACKLTGTLLSLCMGLAVLTESLAAAAATG